MIEVLPVSCTLNNSLCLMILTSVACFAALRRSAEIMRRGDWMRTIHVEFRTALAKECSARCSATRTAPSVIARRPAIWLALVPSIEMACTI